MEKGNRFDDYEAYDQLCKILRVPDNHQKAVFGVDCFYEHARRLLTGDKYMTRVKTITGSYYYHKFI